MMAELIDKSSTLILQNLRLAEKNLLSDPSRILASRDYISRSSCLQICFYLSLALKSFRRQPTILLFGAGHIGSKLIEHLLECRLGHCLRIFARDDSASKYWKARNIQSSNTLADLLRGSTADIVIICSGVSSFASISQSLLPYISKATFIISSCFGLSRKRLFNFLKASSIFRTFQEPQLARMKSEGLLNRYNTSNSNVASTQDLPKRNFTKSLSEQSADLIVRRCPEVRNMILLLENYYSLRGLNHSSARSQSVASLLGKRNDSVIREDDGDACSTHLHLHSCADPRTPKLNDDIALKEVDERVSRQRDTDSILEGLADTSDYYRSLLPPPIARDEGSNECKSLSSRMSKSSKDPHGIHGIHAAQILLQDNVSVHFQRHLSKFILEADIPHSRDLRNDLDGREQPQRLHCTQIGDLGPSCNSLSSAESKAQSMPPDSTSTNGSKKEIVSNTSCNSFPIIISMGSPQLITNVVFSNAVGRRSLDSFSSTVPLKSRYDVNKMDLDAIRLETKAKILEDVDDAPKLRDPLGTAMHSDQDILRIFAEDSVFHGQRTFAACESVHGDEEEEAVPPDSNSTASCVANDSVKSNCKNIYPSLLVLLAELDDIHDFK